MDELPGISVFYKDEAGRIFHTFSAFGRGDEALIGTYSYLDLMPKGRNENGPNFNLMDWVRRHDQYECRCRESLVLRLTAHRDNLPIHEPLMEDPHEGDVER